MNSPLVAPCDCVRCPFNCYVKKLKEKGISHNESLDVLCETYKKKALVTDWLPSLN